MDLSNFSAIKKVKYGIIAEQFLTAHESLLNNAKVLEEILAGHWMNAFKPIGCFLYVNFSVVFICRSLKQRLKKNPTNCWVIYREVHGGSWMDHNLVHQMAYYTE